MSANLVLKRFDYGISSTVGRLFYRGAFVYTLELPWLGNKPFESCIPEGLYRITRDNFRGLYKNYRLHGVEGRTDIELHRGNTTEDTEGCPLVGLELHVHAGKGWTLGSSEEGLDRLMAACTFDEGTILVTSGTGRPW